MSYEGFDEHQVQAAVVWVEQLRTPLPVQWVQASHAHSQRIYHYMEQTHIGSTNLQLLTSLEHNQSIQGQQREHIIERCMQLPQSIVNGDTFKALILTILWADNQMIDDALMHALMEAALPEIAH